MSDSISKRIREAVAHGPLTRDQLASAIAGPTRKRLLNLIHRQVKVGLLVDTAQGLVAGRVPTFESPEIQAKQDRARRDRINARKRANRLARAALLPARVLLTPEERAARVRARVVARLAKEKAERHANPKRPRLTAEERAARKRELMRASYERRRERLAAKGLSPRGKPIRMAAPLKPSKPKPPGLIDCAKSHIAVRIQPRESVEEWMARGNRPEVLPPPTPMAYLTVPVGYHL